MNAMNNQNKLIVVNEATAKQGIVTAKSLVDDGWTVRALTHDMDHTVAKLLKKRGIEVVEIDPNNRSSLDKALVGAYGVYYVSSVEETELEVMQGKLMADAARAAGVQHFIYNSAGGVDRETGIPQLAGKWQVEQYLCSSDMPVTILRPAMLMESVASAGLSNLLMISALSTMVRAEKTIQLISIEDIACFAAIAFSQPEQFVGRTMELAGDAVTLSRITRIRRRVQGARLISLRMPSLLLRRLPVEVTALAEWLDREGYQADIADLRQIHPGLMTFERWLNHRETKAQFKQYDPEPSYVARSV
jgi:uncharacterized protein YbjT (DUF2867 family)